MTTLQEALLPCAERLDVDPNKISYDKYFETQCMEHSGYSIAQYTGAHASNRSTVVEGTNREPLLIDPEIPVAENQPLALPHIPGYTE